MSRYREIYERLDDSCMSGVLSSGKPMETGGMLREAGIDARGTDNRDASLEAVVVYLAEQVKELKANMEGS